MDLRNTRLSSMSLLPIPARVAVSLVAMLVVGALPVGAQEDDDIDRGAALVEEFITILKQPDAEKAAQLEGFLADEFQIVRSNGAVFDKAGYVASPASVIDVQISDVRVTEASGVMVVSYVLAVDEVLEGITTQTIAPRLSVFHEGADGRWRLAAHANFGAIDPT